MHARVSSVVVLSAAACTATAALVSAAAFIMAMTVPVYLLQRALQSLLRVDAVVGNLFASRFCTSRYSSGTLAGVCASYSTTAPTCVGVLPSVTFPVSLLAPAYTSCSDPFRVCLFGLATTSSLLVVMLWVVMLIFAVLLCCAGGVYSLHFQCVFSCGLLWLTFWQRYCEL
jgi:hypothetical protein